MTPTIFFDMDGVLADFVRGALRHHDKSGFYYNDVLWDFPEQIGFQSASDPAFWNPLGEEFWVNLGHHEDGAELYRRLVGCAPMAVLSSPCRTHGCDAGKRRWIEMWYPTLRRNTFLGNNKELIAGRGKILLDDHDDNCKKWIKAGGWAITIPRPWNSRRDECDTDGNFCVEVLLNDVLNAVEVSRVVT